MSHAHELIIAQATIADADGILHCLAAAFEPYRDRYTPAAYLETVLTPDTVRERIDVMIVLVARDASGAIVGTVGGFIQGADNREGHLRGMAVLPASQGTGVAARLLSAIEEELADGRCTEVTLDTTAPLRRAMSFYTRRGSRPTGTVTDFFGMPVYEYRKLLDRS